MALAIYLCYHQLRQARKVIIAEMEQDDLKAQLEGSWYQHRVINHRGMSIWMLMGHNSVHLVVLVKTWIQHKRHKSIQKWIC